jgi:hypothetical protein
MFGQLSASIPVVGRFLEQTSGLPSEPGSLRQGRMSR